MTLLRYVVKTSGRSGSHRILEYFYNRGFYVLQDKSLWDKKYNYDEYENISNDVVVHSQTVEWLPKDINNWNLIISLRHNKMLQAVSALVGKETKQFISYPKKLKKNSITINEDKFINKVKMLIDNEKHLLEVGNLDWKHCKIIYYEDQLDIYLNRLETQNDFYCEKSNIDYSYIISNYTELDKLYKEMSCA